MTAAVVLVVEVDAPTDAEREVYAKQVVEALERQRARGGTREASFDFRAGALRYAAVVDTKPGELCVVMRADFDALVGEAYAQLATEIFRKVHTMIDGQEGPGAAALVEVVAAEYGVTL